MNFSTIDLEIQLFQLRKQLQDHDKNFQQSYVWMQKKHNKYQKQYFEWVFEN